MPTNETTIIDHRRRIKRVMLHVDRHLDRPCRLAEMANVACYSPFHFSRAFEQAMGETPHQYVFRKRMERAGFLLCLESRRVIDIALEVGYETPSAFSKAFSAFAGMSPRRFRDTTSRTWLVKTNRPFHPAAGGQNRSMGNLSPRIKTLPTLTVVYRENRGIVNGSFLETGRASFQRLTLLLAEHDLAASARAYVGIYPYRFFSLVDGQAVSYTGAVIDSDRAGSENMPTLKLPAGRYAIFTHHGPYEFLMQTWNLAYMGWLPCSGAMLRDAPPFEVYAGDASSTDSPASRAWVMIPIL